MIATSSTSIVLYPSVPASTLAEFIAYAKAKRGAGPAIVDAMAGVVPMIIQPG